MRYRLRTISVGLKYISEYPIIYITGVFNTRNYLNSKTNPILMSSNLVPPPPDPFIFIWLFLLLAIFLIIPYLYVRFVEWRLKSFLGKIWQRVSFEFRRKLHWM
jgi:hypothetical protein